MLRIKRKVQNQIGSVHAAAMALLAESTTGLMTGLSEPDDRITVIQSMTLTFLKRATSDMTALTTFMDEELVRGKISKNGNFQVLIKKQRCHGH